jgi:hypothetical protein
MSTIIKVNGKVSVYDLPNAEASVSYTYFEQMAHNNNVLPEHVPALWQKAKRGAERAGHWAMLGAFTGMVHDYCDRKHDSYLQEWLCYEEAGE